VVRDLGSRAGSFLDGEALLPGEDVGLLELGHASGQVTDVGLHELGLGIATTFELWSGRGDGQDHDDERPIALLREHGVADRSERPDAHKLAWTLFAPLGGPVWLTPEQRLPITLGFEGDQVVLLAAARVNVILAGMPIGQRAAIELLMHDRLRLELPGGLHYELEVEEPWG
jgi:hypothetical protein